VGEGKERMVGEDFAFCDDYMRIFKEPIPIWPDFDFVHGATYKGNYHKWLLKKSEEAEKAEATAKVAA
jgi:hypothetical protein